MFPLYTNATLQLASRFFSKTVKPAVRAPIEKKVLMEKFTSSLEPLVDSLLQEKIIDPIPQGDKDYIKRMVLYNVQGGKMWRGSTVARTMMLLKEDWTDEDLDNAIAIGWCIEFLQGFFLVADDIMDNSQTRRKQPCWYLVDDVKMTACNDYLILETLMYRLIKMKFAGTDKYSKLMDLFMEVTYMTEMGQLLDLRSLPPNEEGVNLDRFTESLYTNIVVHKTAYYTIYLPFALGMVLAGETNPKAFEETLDLSKKVGEYFQVQDDYLDCYADPSVLGKIGRDIEEAKCGWLVVQALKIVNKEQRALLDEHYGVDNADSVKKVKELYVDLGIQKIYNDWEEKKALELNEQIENLEFANKDMFRNVMQKLKSRKL